MWFGRIAGYASNGAVERDMRLFTLQLLVTVSTLLLIALGGDSFAGGGTPCECTIPEITDSLKTAELVFVGDLLQEDDQFATIRVVERIKGEVPDKVKVVDSPSFFCVWPVFGERGRYLVYANSAAGTEVLYTPDSCPWTRLLRKISAKDLLTLRMYVRANRETLRPNAPK